jgi:phosphoglycolate phosphatase
LAGIQLAVFDCDGTIVDSQHSIVSAMQAAFKAHGLEPPAAESVKRFVGLPLIEAVAQLFPKGKPGTHQQIRESYRKAYSTAREQGRIHEPKFSDIDIAFDTLEAAGWLLGVATGKSHVGLVNTLGAHGLLERFQTIQTADKAAGKPNPDMLIKAMAETGANEKDTVMIGDTTFDIEMARSAGTLSVGVAWGYHDAKELSEAGADIIVHHCAEIPNAVLELVKAG